MPQVNLALTCAPRALGGPRGLSKESMEPSLWPRPWLTLWLTRMPLSMEGRGQDLLETQGRRPAGQLAVSSQRPSCRGQTLTNKA